MVVDSRSVAQWWLARSLLLLLLLVLSVEWLVVQRCLDAAAGTDPLLFKAKCADRCLSTCVCVVVVACRYCVLLCGRFLRVFV